ncbi:HlyD family type I secretion periplasmic adaptor subunit [Rhodoferax sp.]|uniref:HlyD family type I secretion periplasmic adaptor subunit n=1 Tax=Rhodoferax sp. TaxID=50421 RepID=UPI00263742D9|nr:HlyD family type I secretion periplasmic adaptor subunit [Rhodoferax sp.]MDD2811443.1 HlyD family type I secretion periplasmic adaptor subunit [Rhodoferax sp.]MDD2811447.1 HlyD family type I secretion periplasmic adaptor subunit [Rhodoferax sp.]
MAIKDILKNTTPGASSSASNDGTPDTQKLTAHTGRSARIGLWALGLGFGGFLLWAGLAPLDEGVPSQGMISIDTKRKTVQHLTGGLVKEVLVGEGELVKEGQLLIRLDEGVARANFEAARQRYVGLRAMEGRLQAEQRGASKIIFHPDVLQAANDPQIREVVFTQEQLFNSRRAALQADLQSTQESIQGQQGLIQAYESMLANRKSQQALLAEELANTRSLVKEGYAPRNRQLELERMNAESSASIAELMGNTIRAKRAVAELQQRAIARQQEYRKEVETQLADVGRELPGDAEKLRAAKDDFSRIDIKSPATGQVVGLAFQTVGGVIGPGQKLMDIVPQDQALLIEARVAPHLIDRVNNGMLVDVRFSSFAHTPQLVVQGKVVSVSGDVLVDPQTGVGYYLARVGVTAEGYKQLGKRQLQPGMPVEVVFLTGERSMLTYLLSPLTKRLAASMKEE